MAKTIMVTPEELDSTATKIEGLAADYKSLYDKLYDKAGEMRATWEGKDNVAYIIQIEGFKDNLAEMHQLMLNYADFLKKSATAYRNTQDEIAKNAGKLAN